jgi:hypothetical protein
MLYTKAHSLCPFHAPTLQLIDIACHKCKHLYDCMLVNYTPMLPFAAVDDDSPSGLTRTPQISEDFVPAQNFHDFWCDRLNRLCPTPALPRRLPPCVTEFDVHHCCDIS